VPTVRLKRNHLVRFPLDRRRLLSAETHRDDPVADGREPLDNGRRARRLRLVRVVDCDDQVGAGVDGLAQRLGQFVRADPVFRGDGVVADCVERGVVEPEPRRCSPRVDVDESGERRLDRSCRCLNRPAWAAVGCEPLKNSAETIADFPLPFGP